MGAVYLAAGVVTWRSLGSGKHMAATIFALNLVVLGIISYLYVAGEVVATDSLHAMTFRTSVWLVLFLGLVWISRRSRSLVTGPASSLALQPSTSSRLV